MPPGLRQGRNYYHAGDLNPSSVATDWFNTWGYNLLGEHREKDALAVFQLNAWAHPNIANLQDSLADGLSAVEDKGLAREAVERAIELVPRDLSIDSPSAKSAFLIEEKAKLQQLK